MTSFLDPIPDVSLKYAIVPRPNTRASRVRTKAQLGFQIRLNIELTGLMARSLRSSTVNRIIGFFDTTRGLLRSLGFTYDDGTELIYGSHIGRSGSKVWNPDYGLSFAIDGRRGERLDEIRAHTCCHTFIGNADIRGLQVC